MLDHLFNNCYRHWVFEYFDMTRFRRDFRFFYFSTSNIELLINSQLWLPPKAKFLITIN